ncbi:hypothetical protein [Virgibacillus sp. CBA3643]|uniref:hypothetical protein n=1 Tax=Virgibacillus sp. CBA3643 TaxID=2942278 RepID=UPI0035A2A762
MDSHQGYSHTYVSVLIYFIDYLLQVPPYLTKKLRDNVSPLLNKEVVQKMQTERSNPSPTLAEIFDEREKEGKKEAMKQFAEELILENFSDDYIAKLTKLSVEEVALLRKSL